MDRIVMQIVMQMVVQPAVSSPPVCSCSVPPLLWLCRLSALAGRTVPQFWRLVTCRVLRLHQRRGRAFAPPPLVMCCCTRCRCALGPVRLLGHPGVAVLVLQGRPLSSCRWLCLPLTAVGAVLRSCRPGALAAPRQHASWRYVEPVHLVSGQLLP
jgi:hypothetical protein